MPNHAFEFESQAGDVTAWRHARNGLQVLTLRDATAPVVACMITYRVGSRNETKGLTGATHFLEHLMFKGSERFNKDAGTSVFQVLQRLGAQVNATTWVDRTNYYSLLPAIHLEKAIEIEADRMRGARIRDEDVDSERTVILNELDRGENEPLRKLYQAVWATAFEKHPYHHPTIGWRSDVETVTANGLRGFYDTYYWPDSATISVIGDIESDDVLSLLDRHFGGIPSAPKAAPNGIVQEPEQIEARSVTVNMAGQLGSIMLAYKSPEGLSDEVDALSTLATVLTAGKGSRLYRSLTDQGLTASQSASASRFRDPGLFYVYAMLAPGHSHEAVERIIRDELLRIASDGVDDAELERARARLRAQEAYGRDGPFSVAASLNEAIAVGDWSRYVSHRSRMEGVTSDDVRRAASTVCQTTKSTVGYFVPTAG